MAAQCTWGDRHIRPTDRCETALRQIQAAHIQQPARQGSCALQRKRQRQRCNAADHVRMTVESRGSHRRLSRCVHSTTTVVVQRRKGAEASAALILSAAAAAHKCSTEVCNVGT